MPYKRKSKYIGQSRRNGQRKEKIFLTKKEALAWEAEMRRLPDAEWDGKTNTVCLGDWANAYLDFAKAKFSEKTYAEKRMAFRNLFQVVEPALPMDTLTPAMVLAYLQKQMEARSGYAANKDRKNLVAAWNWGTRYMDPALPSPNPCFVHKMPEQRMPRYIPPEDDFWRVYHVAEGQDKVMLLTFLHLAARRGEVFRLKTSDLDFENKRVRLSTRKRMGGNLEYDWLPMTNELAEALEGWLKDRPVKSESVFVCLDETPLSRDYYGMPFQYRLQFMGRLCDKAEVKRFGFHAIRHLTATCLYKQGQSVGVIQAILRHTSPSTTERYLKTLGLEEVRGALEGLSNRRALVLRLQPKAGADAALATTENKKAV